MTDRSSRIRALGDHLKGRYIPFSEPRFNAEVATLDASDAYALAAVAIDFMDAGYQQNAPMIHVGVDGQPHEGPRAECARCQPSR